MTATRPPPKPESAQAGRFLVALVLFMHITVMTYLAMLITILQTAKAADLITAKVFQPATTVATYVAPAVLHVYGVVSVVCCRRKGITPSRPGVGPSVDAIPKLPTWQQYLHDKLYAHSIVIVFNLVEIASDLYQAHLKFERLTDPSKVLSYAAIVVLYCFVSPLILFVRNTQAQASLVNIADAIVSFTLSCGHPFGAIVIQLLDYVLVNRFLEHDNLWSTQTLLMVRHLVPSTTLHLATTVALHVGTFLALRRAVNTSHHIHLVFTTTEPPDTPRTRSTRIKQALAFLVNQRSLSLHAHFKLSQRKRLLLRVNLVLNVVLGLASIVLITRSIALRTPCPSYCRAHARPLFDLTCHCAYVNINCALQGVSDPAPLLAPALIGTSALYMEISRCDLPLGLSYDTLAPFEELSKLMLLFTHMESWDGPLPPGINHVIVRHSRLQSVPRALVDPISPALVAIFLEHSPLQVVPDHSIRAWSHVRQLNLVNVTIQEVPPALLELVDMQELNLRSNNLTTLPTEWTVESAASSSLQLVQLGGNQLTEIPWALARRRATIDLSGNPIPVTRLLNDMQAMVASRQVILDGTPHCTASTASSCKPTCSPQCGNNMVQDHYCDLECFSKACAIDGGDCGSFGLTEPTPS